MRRISGISDEELAAYLEHALQAEENERVEAAMDVDTLEVLGVARRALAEFEPGETVLPSWDEVDTGNAFRRIGEPLAMAGFLGDEGDGGDERDEEVEEDGEDE